MTIFEILLLLLYKIIIEIIHIVLRYFLEKNYAVVLVIFLSSLAFLHKLQYSSDELRLIGVKQSLQYFIITLH